MATSHSHVTITILPCSLSLVHIPRSRIAELSRPILKQILRKEPTFLNLTANEIELSVFAEDEQVVDFEPIARRDRQRQRVRDRDARAGSAHGHRTRRVDVQPVEISLEKWKVLQIDAHEDSLSNSGSRVRELSAPLAAAGISILYQSSYMSDFIFVKESRLAEVMQLLDANGFSMYDSDPHGIGSTPILDDIPEGQMYQSVHQIVEVASGFGYSYPGSPGTASPRPRDGAVFSRTRSPSLASLNALSLAMSRSATLDDLRTMARSHPEIAQRLALSGATSPATRTPKKSMSPTAAPVEVLSPDIACVGLSESAADVWGIKILTLVGYPELIPSPASSSPVESRFRAQTATSPMAESMYGSVYSNPRIRQGSFGPEELSPADEHLERSFDAEVAVRSKRFTVGDADPSSGSSSPDSPSSSFSEDDGDEYFSSSSPYTRTRDDLAMGSTPSLVSSVSRSSARSLPDRLDAHYRSTTTTRSALRQFEAERRHQRAPASSEKAPPPAKTEQDRRRNSSSSTSSSRGRAAKRPSPRVPFFSFTRTAEGSSLTTDLGVLAALFGAEERHMIISQGDILNAGDELNEEAAAAEEYRRHSGVFDLDEAELFDKPEENGAQGTMKCLQIDLQKFGLEKHGLVNRFSRVLEDNGINHMYSSTIKTANLLVDKGNARRAQLLLRSC